MNAENKQQVISLKKRFEWRNVGRWIRYKYLQLLRAKGGPHIVAIGFSIGLAIEMFTLPTGGLAFFLIFPLVYLFRASFAAALIGFVFGKIIYIPMMFLNRKVGYWVLPKHSKHLLLHSLPPWLADFLNQFIKYSLSLMVGGMIVGVALGIVLYFPVRLLLRYASERRKERRRERKSAQNG